MPDATLSFLEKFNDPAQWDRVLEGVPIFEPHKLTGKDGKPLVVDVNRLKKIAEGLRYKFDHKGVALQFTDGHTKLIRAANGQVSVAPQEEQPETLSYGVNPRMGFYGKEQTPCILVDEYVVKGKGGKRKDYPHRSAEFYGPSDEIFSVALLKTKPRLDMGMVTYQQPAKHIRCYDTMADWYFYAEDGMPHDEHEHHGPGDPAAAPDAKAPDDEFTQKVHQCIHHYIATNLPHLHAMHAVHAQHMAAGGQVPGATPGMPAMPPGSTPPHHQPQGNSLVGGVDQGPPAGHHHAGAHHMQTPQIPEQYQAQLTAYQNRIAAMEKQLRVSSYRQLLLPLAQHYGFNLDKQLALVQDMDQSHFDAHVANLREVADAYKSRVEDPAFYQADLPTAGPQGRIPSQDDSADGGFTEKHLVRAQQYTHAYPADGFEVAEMYALSSFKTPTEFKNKPVTNGRQ